MGKVIKLIWSMVNILLFAMVIILVNPIVITRISGMELLVVQSGSMEPDYPTGALICVKDVDPATLEVGDVITFNMTGATKGTHRIVEIVRDAEDPDIIRFRTKGDANDTVDNRLVETSELVGEVKLSIPRLGYLIAYIQQPPGMYIAIASVAAIMLSIVLFETVFGEDKTKKNR